MAPVVAGVSLGLLALALVGLRLTLNFRAQVRRDQERLRELASLAVEGLAVCDGMVITTANRSLERLSGLGAGALNGRHLSELFPGLDVTTMPEREAATSDWAASRRPCWPSATSGSACKPSPGCACWPFLMR